MSDTSPMYEFLVDVGVACWDVLFIVAWIGLIAAAVFILLLVLVFGEAIMDWVREKLGGSND